MDNRSCVHFGCCRQQFATLLDHNLVTLCVSLPRTPVTLLPSSLTLLLHKVTLHNLCSTKSPWAAQLLLHKRFSVSQSDKTQGWFAPQSWWSCIHSKTDCQWKYIWCKTTSNTLQGHTSCSVHRPPAPCQFCGAVFGDWGPCGRFGDKTRLFLLYLHLWSPHALGSPLEMWRLSILLVSTILSSFVTMFV